MKVSRMKRMTGIGSLLVALALIGTGCTTLPAPGNDAPADPGPKVEKVSEYDPATVVLDAEWEAAYGQDLSISTPIVDAGLNILGVMYDRHPEYTVHGFIPTDENWNTVAAEFKPLVNVGGLNYMESQWEADKSLPVMTSYRTTLDENGEHGYTFTTEAGEKCTDSNRPYEYTNELVTLTARPDASGAQVPIFSSNVSLRVHCQEGTTLSGQLYTWFPMQQVDGQWKMFDNYDSSPTGPFELMPR